MVIAAAGEPPFVYGHPSGGILPLEAAARGVEMRGLAVYEPPYTELTTTLAPSSANTSTSSWSRDAVSRRPSSGWR